MRKTSRYLVTMPYGIGDTVHISLAVIDQIIRNDPKAEIDVLANPFQAEILADDPRIHLITISRDLFATQQKKTWYKMFFTLDPKAKLLKKKLKKRQYEMIFPGNMAFGFLHSLGSKVLYPSIKDIYNDAKKLKNYKDAQASIRSKLIINKHFNNASTHKLDESIRLYIKESTYKQAQSEYAQLFKRKNNKIILVAPDTTSPVTRPPLKLLTKALLPFLEASENIQIIILPSYSDRRVSKQLQELLQDYKEKVFRIPQRPRPSLLASAVWCDLADVVITGDTGIMHLSAAEKFILSNNKSKLTIQPRNRKNTVAIFGGTNPGLYGHPTRTIIVGRGHLSQAKIRPGFFKEGYNPRNVEYFTHISSAEIIKIIDKLLLKK